MNTEKLNIVESSFNFPDQKESDNLIPSLDIQIIKSENSLAFKPTKTITYISAPISTKKSKQTL